ncbi:MAG TPA: ComEC/Rec2 family competence protein [Verrucomicrobiae bacterium]|nr:ComEC/Rec2 family competence protein [Verrucomicrobiae bacterium]
MGVEKIVKYSLPAPAFWAAVAFAAGIFISALTTNHLLFWFIFSALVGIGASFFHFRSNNAAANLGVLLLLVGLGAVRYSAATDVAEERSVAHFAGLDKRLLITGRVCDLPDVKPERTRIYLDEITIGWTSKLHLDGKVRLTIGRAVTSYVVGDRIGFVGRLDSLWQPANPGALDFARLMRIRGVQASVYLKDDEAISVVAQNLGSWRARLSKIRDGVERKLTTGLPRKASGVIKGFVLGDTRDIEPSTYDLFRKTGTLHLLAVSGANVAWVAMLPIFLLKLFFLPLRTRYLVALFVVWVFVLLTDLQASVLRAAIMFTVWTTSRVVYREISGLQSLGLCALVLLVLNPLWFFDIGFELSFLAVFALIFSFEEKDEHQKNWAKRWLIQPFHTNLGSSVAVFLLITPLLAYYFNQVAWTSLLVNVMAMPLAALISWCALVRLGIGFTEFSSPLAFVQEKLFEWLFAIQNLFVNLPHTLVRVPHPNGVETFLLTIAGFGLFLIFFKSQYKKVGVYLFLLGLAPVLWGWGFKRSSGFSLSVLEAKGEMVSVLSLLDQIIVIGGGEVRDAQHTPRQVVEPVLAYLGRDKIEGYLPLRFDSFGQAASAEIVTRFRPGFVGWPVARQPKEETADSMTLKFEYLLTSGDSVPFALRVIKEDYTFLFVPQFKRFRPPRWDSLFDGPTVLIAPLEFPRAESLARFSNVKVVVSTRRDYRLFQTGPDRVFFTFRDGAVNFRVKKEEWEVRTHFSKRKLAFGNR